jgi:hypothetical protein
MTSNKRAGARRDRKEKNGKQTRARGPGLQQQATELSVAYS